MRLLSTALVLGLALSQLPPRPVSAQVVKVATLVPDGSFWGLILEEQIQAWEEGTDGRLDVRVYPGGVAGDDPAIVRKMRIGQFQAGALSFQGLMEIDEGFSVLALTSFYESQEELQAVLASLEPLLAERLEENGFILLNWGFAGWARLYCKRPVRSPDDFRSQKMFVWGGDEPTMRIYRSQGLQPVGVAATDVTLALQTGMIDCIGTPPLVALTLQYFRQASYQLEQPLAPFIGATVMTSRAWNALSAADQEVILEASAAAQQRYLEEVPDQEARAIAAMEDRGLQVTSITPETRDEWEALAANMIAQYRGTLVPVDIFDRAIEARDEFRAAQPDG